MSANDSASAPSSYYPLTDIQRGILLQASAVPEDSLYHAQVQMDLSGTIDVRRLVECWESVTARHGSLRTSISADGEYGEVWPRVEVPVTVEDWTQMGEAGREEKMAAALSEDLERVFDLQEPPLWRLLIIRWSASSVRVLWSFHHALLDGASASVVLRDVQREYEGLVAEHNPAQFSNLVTAAGEGLDSREDDEFWDAALSGVEPAEALPFDLREPGGLERLVESGRHGFDAIPILIPDAVAAGMHRLADSMDSGLVGLVRAAWSVVLGVYYDKDDVILGVTESGRVTLEDSEVVGPMVRTLPLRLHLPAELGIANWLAQADAAQSELVKHQGSSLVKVQERSVGAGRELFRTLVTADHAESPTAGWQILASESRVPYALVLVVSGTPKAPRLQLHYDRRACSERIVLRAAGHLERVLTELPQKLDEPLGRLGMLSTDELDELCHWNDTAQDQGDDVRIECLVEQAVAQTPEAPAVFFKDEWWSYRDIEERANRVARYLRSRGLTRGEHVAVLTRRSALMIADLLGILKAGGCYVPLEPATPSARRQVILTALGVRYLLIQSEFLPCLDSLESVDSLSHVVCCDGPGREVSEGLSAESCEAIDGQDPSPIPAVGTAEDSAYVIFTSGSTGIPKGVVVSHRPVINMIRWVNRTFSIGPDDRMLFVTSLTFDLSVYDMFGILAAGGSIRVAAEDEIREPARLVAMLRDEPVTFWDSAPAALMQLIPFLGQEPGEIVSRDMRLVFMSGDWIPVDSPDTLRRAFPALTVVGLGGATEATVWSNYFVVDRVDPRWVSIPYGKPIANARYYVLDASYRQCPVGVPGDLFIAGPCLSVGYAGDPGLTSEKYLPDLLGKPGDRMYRTGDRARWRPDGNLEFLGRLDSQVKIRGYRIELGEIDSVLRDNPMVEDAATVVRTDPGGDRSLLTAVVLRASEVAEEFGAELSSERVERWRVVYDSLPYESEKRDDFAGWTSSFTGRPLPLDDMRAWRDEAVELVRRFNPSHVLEIGCGSGLILMPLAEAGVRCTGLDLSASAVDSVRHRVSESNLGGSVTLRHGDALDLPNLDLEPVDTVLMNSVVQYFPNADYLARALDAALDHVSDGGRLIVGDVRSLPLLEAFHTAVVVARSDNSTTRGEARAAVRRGVEAEEELVLAPAFFRAWAERSKRVVRVEIKPKMSSDANEMALFRYQVVLHVGPQRVPDDQDIPELSFAGRAFDCSEVVAALEQRPAALRITGVPLARLTESLEAVRWLSQEGANASLGEFDPEQGLRGIDPEVLTELVNRSGYQVSFSWEEHGSDGAYDAFLSLSGEAIDPQSFISDVHLHADVPLEQFANQPLSGEVNDHALLEIRNFLEDRLPPYMLPGFISVLDRLPITSSGKLDRKALIEGQPVRTAKDNRPARNMVEQVLVGLWKSTLGLADVGIGDNFFDLGGHSLLAAQLVTRLKGTFGFDLPIRVLLEHPTISEVATELYRINRDRDVPPAQPLVVVHDDAPAPASFEQRRLYFLEQLTPGMKAYTINWIVPLPARTATEDAWRCLRLMAERHEALRTVLRVRDGEVVQIVSTDPWGEPRTEDVTSTDEARVAIREFWDQAFDLDDGPLARAMLLRIADDQDCLAMSAHHTVFDGYSIGLFVTEYIAMLQSPGADKLESGETIRYGDYARWQSCWLDEPHFGAQVDFWRHELQGTPEVLALPTDRPRPKEQSFDGAVIRRELSTELSNRLAEVARGLRVTDYVVILSAFSALLARYSGQDVVVVGVPVASRVRLELEPILGFLVNSLPVGVDLRSTPTFGELLQQVQMRLLNAQAHQEIPLERLIDALGSQRDLSYNPLFQVMCADESLPLLEHVSDKMPVSPWMLDMVEQGMSVGVARFDLTLMARKVGRSWKLDFEYDTALFDAATIAEMADRFGVFIEAALNDPEALVETLPLMSAEDSASSLSVLSTPQVYLQPSLPGSLVESWSTILRRCPDRVAVSWGGGQVSYGVLDVLSDGVAGLLRGCGVGRGSLVGLCVPRSFEAVVVLLGVVKAGAGYVPLDPSYPADRLEFMVSDSGVSVVVASRDSLAVVPEGVSQVLIVEEFWSGLGSAAGGFVDSGAGLDDVAYVMYTSGSTGRPKGVAVTHGGILDLVYDSRFAEHHMSVLMHSPQTFDASTYELWVPLAHGGTCHLLDGPELAPQVLRRMVSERGLTAMFITAALFHHFAQEDPACFATMAEVWTGGEAVQSQAIKDVLDACPGLTVFDVYGPTEDTTFATCASFHDSSEVPPVPPIGRPLTETRALVLDGGLRVVPVGVAGELFVGGPGLARGYLGRPDLTAERFVADPFAGDGSRLYRTGDRVRVLADGNLEWLGRLDDQVKIRGFRVELGEIESVLGRHPAVRQAVVVVNDQGRSKRLVGFVVLREAVSGEVLRAFAGESLPAYMVPSVVMDVESLPLGPTGKVDRRALAAFPVADSGVEFVSPRSVVEERLAVLWRDVLGLDRPVGVFDGFFALGGDSILSLQLVFRAKQEGLFFSVKDLFRYQTIAELAPEVSCAEAPEVVADQGIVVGGVELSPVQRWFFSRGLVNPDYFNQSVVVDVPTGLGVNVWERLVLRLLEQHDAFRCRFERGSDGWRAEFVEMPSVAPLEVVDVSGVDVAGVAARVAEVGSRVQAGLSLGEAPLFRAVLFAGGGDGSDRLLLVAHHLVVDVVSWRVVLEDLDALLECVSQGREWVLPKKSSSWLQWMSRLVEDAGSAASLAEVGYWRDQVSVSGELPVAAGAGANVMARSGVLDEVLGVEDTRGLLQEVPAVFGTRVNDALLTAVAAAVGAWSGADQVRLDLEGHGREDVFEGVDVSRTVGWFTTISPVALPVPSRGDLGAGLKRVKELLRGRPRQGLGYGLVRESDEVLASAVPAQMSFNYLGQFEAGAGGGFAAGAGLAGPDWDPANERPYLIDIVGRVEDQMLHLEWSYGPSHSREVIARVAKDTMDVLRQLVGLARSGQVQGYSPSDLPLSGLDQDALDEAVAAWRELPAWRLGRSGRPVEDCYPQTPIQQGLWFQSQFAAGEGVYHVQMVFDIDQPVDLEVFREAWVRVMRRHSILRTSFWGAGTDHALQIVWDTDQVPLTVVDWRDDPAGPEDRLAGFLSDDRTRGFEQLDLPQWRVLLARTGEQTYKVVWSAHHAILDGWSIGLVLHDLTRCYAAVLNHEQLDLPAPVSYRDYVAWLTAQPTEPTEQFWRDYLATLTNPTPLPTVGRVDPKSKGQQKKLTMPLNADLRESMRVFAQGQGVTVNTLMQAAWALLLARYTGRDDVVFGTVVSGRTDQVKDVERIVGLFINTLPLYVTIPPNQTVKDWLADLQRVNLQLRQHEHTPLHEIQHWTQVPPGTSLFNTLFVFENYPEQDWHNESLPLIQSGGREQTHYSLNLIVSTGEQWQLDLIFDDALFDNAAAEALLSGYVQLCRSLVTDADVELATMTPLTDEERVTMLESWSRETSDDADVPLMHEVLEKTAQMAPDRVAVSVGDRQITYGELDDRANQLARWLRKRGVAPETLVGHCLDRSVEAFIAIFGVLKAGGAYVPVDPSYPAERIAFVVADAGLDVFLTLERHRDKVLADGLETLCLDTEWDAVAGADSSSLQTAVSANNLAYIIYTSGSTGRPKGVMVEHRCIRHVLPWIPKAGLDASRRILQAASLSFDFSVWEILLPFATGGVLNVPTPGARMIGTELAAILTERAIESLNFTPGALATLEPGSYDHLKSLLVGGEAYSADLVRTWARGRKFVNVYGPTETTIFATGAPLGSDLTTIHMGRPITNVRLYVLDTSMRPVPCGVPGELYIGGAGLTRGYLNRPDLTAQYFVADPFGDEPGGRLYKSGDLVRFLADGNVEFVGRADGQVKIRGFRVELAEIQAVIEAHSSVTTCAVVVRGQGSDAHLIAYVACATACSIDDLREYLAAKLPPYMVPSAFVFLDTLPLNPNGKVDRRALPDPGDFHVGLPASAPAETATEAWLVDLWREALGRDSVGVDDDFFELGGHSLLAVRIVARIGRDFGVEVPLQTVFDQPTIRRLAAVLDELAAQGEDVTAARLVPVDRNQPVPATFDQSRLWFMERLNPDTALYTVGWLQYWVATPDRDGLLRALNAVVSRHESLRTTFKEESGQLWQRIADEPLFEFEERDLRAIEYSSAADEVRDGARRMWRQPFDLAEGPLLRVTHMLLPEGDSVLCFGVHHAVIDGFSIGLLERDLRAAYDAAVVGQSELLPAPDPIQYADFAVWQEQAFGGEQATPHVEHFVSQLADAPGLLTLPTDFPRPAKQDYRGANTCVPMPLALGDALDKLARAHRTSRFVVTLSAFGVLLGRYAGQDKVVIGIPVANRSRAETEPIVGFLVNTVALKIDLSGDPTFAELIAQVHRDLRDAQAHQDVPFERVVEALNPERTLAHSPVFQVLFTGLDEMLPDLKAAGAPDWVEAITDEGIGVSRFDLAVSLEQQQESLRLSVEYCTGLFRGERIARMGEHFVRLLQELVTSPEQTVKRVPLLSDDEVATIVFARNDRTDESIAQATTLPKLFREQVSRTPDRVALSDSDQQVTYAELDARIQVLTDRLRAAGVGPESAVGICMYRSLELVISLYAIQRAGAAYVPLDPDFPKERLAYIASDAKLALALAEERTREHLGDAFSGDVMTVEASTLLGALDAISPTDLLSPDNLAYILYTSGSTGRPKGAMLAHRGVVNRLLWMQRTYPIGEGDCLLQKTPFGFDVSVWEFFWPLLCGARLHVARPEGHKEPAYLAETIERQGVRVVHFVPSMLQAFLAQPNLTESCASLDHVVCSGEALPLEIQDTCLRLLPDARLHNLYGPTEASVDVSFWECHDEERVVSVPIGHPVANTFLYVLDDSMAPVPDGVVGELFIAGVQLARGYLGRPDLTAEKFIANPFGTGRVYATGDLARYRPDGTIEYVGRKDHQVKIRGFRIEIDEIEGVLAESPDVESCLVMVYEVSASDKRLTAFVTARDDDLDTEKLRTFMASRLPDYMVPTYIVRLEAFPLNTNGKVDRRALPALDDILGDLRCAESWVAPRNEMESELSELWQQLLGLERVGVRDDFFGLGGHSLLVASMATSVQQRWGVEIKLQTVFANRTVERLAEVIERALVEGTPVEGADEELDADELFGFV